jgi:hypothetical protein
LAITLQAHKVRKAIYDLANGGVSNGTVGFRATATGVSSASLTPFQGIFFRVPACKPLVSLALNGTKP